MVQGLGTPVFIVARQAQRPLSIIYGRIYVAVVIGIGKRIQLVNVLPTR
jgi:hypothetical protein